MMSNATGFSSIMHGHGSVSGVGRMQQGSDFKRLANRTGSEIPCGGVITLIFSAYCSFLGEYHIL